MISPDDVTAVIVTRKLTSEMKPIFDSLIFDDVIVWDNSTKPEDMGAFGRYVPGLHEQTKSVVYFQDDDCIVRDIDQLRLCGVYKPGRLAALMPDARTDYHDTVLIGWGSLGDADLPRKAFNRWLYAGHETGSEEFMVVGCDFVFPMLTPSYRLSAEHRDLPHAHAVNRTWGSYPDYANVKERILRDARRVRDGE